MDGSEVLRMPTMTRAGYTPPREMRPPGPPEREKKPRKRKKKKKKGRNTADAVSIMIVLIAVLIGSATLYIYAQTEPYAQTFSPGTMLGDSPLAGLTPADAAALLAEQTEEALAAWQFEMTYQGRTYLLRAQDVSLGVDAQATLDPLWEIGHSGSMVKRYLDMLSARNTPVSAEPVLTYDMDAVDAMLEKVRADIEREPEDASVEFLPGNSEPFRFTQEIVGLALDTAPLRSRIEASILSLTPSQESLEPEEIAPARYQAEYENATVLRARVTMQLVQDEASATNASLAARSLHGLRIEAGESLSFNEAVGRRTQEAGYVFADEPAYGPNVAGVGGGVCQVSTALYQAALLGGIEVTSRSAAVYPVGYCEMGQEAAVSDQGLDLVIENSTQMPLFLTARVYTENDAHYVEIQLIGEALEERYALVSQPLETMTPTEPVYVRDSEGRYATYTDERVPVLEAMTGYTSLVERVTLDEEGNAIARETISEDEYDPIPQAIYVGVTERE